MTTSAFKDALANVMTHEGGYVNDRHDPGGETNMGISKRSYPSEDIKNLTVSRAMAIYEKDYWDKIEGDMLPAAVAFVLFDMAVNMGVRRAVRLLQNIIGGGRDGIVGPETLRKLAAQPVRHVVLELTTERILSYADMSGWGRFGEGWTRRSLKTLALALEKIR